MDNDIQCPNYRSDISLKPHKSCSIAEAEPFNQSLEILCRSLTLCCQIQPSTHNIESGGMVSKATRCFEEERMTFPGGERCDKADSHRARWSGLELSESIKVCGPVGPTEGSGPNSIEHCHHRQRLKNSPGVAAHGVGYTNCDSGPIA